MFYKLTNDVPQFHTHGRCICISTEMYVLFTLPIANSQLCKYFNMVAILQKHVVNFYYEHLASIIVRFWYNTKKITTTKCATKEIAVLSKFSNNVSWCPFSKPATMADTGTIPHSSITENVHSVLMYMCTNFCAFITKWTIGLICRCSRWRLELLHFYQGRKQGRQTLWLYGKLH